MKKLLVSGVLALSLMMPSCITTYASKPALAPKTQLVDVIKDGRYDNHNAFVDESKYSLEEILDSVEMISYNIKYSVSYKDKEGLDVVEEKELGFLGSGVVIEKKGGKAYILTNSHVVTEPDFGDLPDGVKFEKISEKITIIKKGVLLDTEIEAKRVASDSTLDVALLEVEDGGFKKFPYKIGNSKDLRPGDFVYIAGNPQGIEDYVLNGNVSKVNYPYNPDWFMIGCDVQGGYSGGAVIAIRDGEYELVGLVVATLVRRVEGDVDALGGYGIAIKINPIMDFVNKHLDKAKTAQQEVGP